MNFKQLNREYEFLQDQFDPAEREETPEHRRRHLMQFFRGRNRKYYRDQRSRELVSALYDIAKGPHLAMADKKRAA